MMRSAAAAIAVLFPFLDGDDYKGGGYLVRAVLALDAGGAPSETVTINSVTIEES